MGLHGQHRMNLLMWPSAFHMYPLKRKICLAKQLVLALHVQHSTSCARQALLLTNSAMLPIYFRHQRLQGVTQPLFLMPCNVMVFLMHKRLFLLLQAD